MLTGLTDSVFNSGEYSISIFIQINSLIKKVNINIKLIFSL